MLVSVQDIDFSSIRLAYRNSGLAERPSRTTMAMMSASPVLWMP